MTSNLRFINGLRSILDLVPLSHGRQVRGRQDSVEIAVRCLRMDRRPLYIRARELRERTKWS